MKLPRVYPILDSQTLEARGMGLAVAAAAFLEGGAEILQIRHKGHWGREVFEAARETARLCREAGAQLIIDDRADFAMLLEAGLHVGQDDLAPQDARRLMGPAAISGFRATTWSSFARPRPSRWITWRWARSSPPPPSATRTRWWASRKCGAAAGFWRSRWWPSAALRWPTPRRCCGRAPIRWR